jgi:hypothetical protein
MGRPVVGVVVADHRQAFAEGLGIILDAHDGLAVLGVAHDTRRAVQLARGVPEVRWWPLTSGYGVTQGYDAFSLARVGARKSVVDSELRFRRERR